MYLIKRKLFHLIVLSSLAILPFIGSEVAAAQQPATPSVTSSEDSQVALLRRGYWGGGYRDGIFNRGGYYRGDYGSGYGYSGYGYGGGYGYGRFGIGGGYRGYSGWGWGDNGGYTGFRGYGGFGSWGCGC